MPDESRKNNSLERFYFDKPGPGTYHTAAMPGDLPKFLDLNRVGKSPVTLSGRLELKQLSRLRDVVRSDGYATVYLQAADELGRKRVSGRIRAELELTCQRCLGPMKYPAAADVNLMWVRAAGGAERMPEGYDAVVSVTGRVNVASLVEDELLLVLPMVARHEPPAKCMARFSAGAERTPAGSGNPASGPFAALKALKRH